MGPILIPAVGKSAGPATLRRWHKKAGDRVAKGEVFAEVETDEGLAYLEAAADSVLAQVNAKEGDLIAPGTSIGQWSVGAASAAVASQTANKLQASATVSKPTGTVIPVVMPKAGQSMEEGTLVKWHVKPGDTITKGQVIFEIETDKATMEVEATDAGRLSRIVLDEGGTIKVLEPVAYLADNDADVDTYIQSEKQKAESGNEAPTVPAATPVGESIAQTVSLAPGERPKASPAARKIAAERGVDLAAAGAGSGPGGRILSTDVPAAAAPVATPVTPASSEGVTRKRLSNMRKVIARNLSLSKQTIPHFYIKATIQADALMSFYAAEKAKYQLSINDIVVAACARVLMEFPGFRSRIEGEELVTFPSANIGIAVGMDDGLVVPVLQAAEKLTLKQIGEASKRLANNARSGKIEGMGTGLFTISNMGMFGVEEFSAIINPPEAAILAVGAAREEVIVSGGTLRAGRVMSVNLSVDHRVVDGALAAKFLKRLKEVLEWPQQLV